MIDLCAAPRAAEATAPAPRRFPTYARMKKHLSLFLRVALAVLGLAFIAWKLDWHDQVEVPAGTTVRPGWTLDKPLAGRVTSGDFNPNRVDHDLGVSLTAADASTAELTVRPSDLGNTPGHYRLRPGIITTLRHANVKLLALGLLLVAPIYPIQTVRWWLLLRCRGLDVPMANAFRLTMIGCFFNYCMPGMTGGDVVRAYYAAKGTDRRATAVMSVVFDRVVGLLGLVLLAGLAGLFILDDPVARKVTLYIWLSAAAVTLASALYFSKRLRRQTGIDWLIGRFHQEGFIARVDQAAVAYGDHKGVVLATILMSLPVHLALCSATAVAGYALGMQTSFGLLLTVVPVLMLAGAVPMTYQGLGVMEGLAMAMLLHPPIATANHIVGMLLLIRLYQVLYSLLGSVYLLRGDVHMHPEQEAQADAEPAPVEVAAAVG